MINYCKRKTYHMKRNKMISPAGKCKNGVPSGQKRRCEAPTGKFTRIKKLFPFLTLALVAVLLLPACSKNTNPADSDIFVGTYKGSITYVSADQSVKKSDDNGSVTVSKVGSTYNFAFGSGIPDINGVKFQKSDDGTYISVGSGLTGITIDAHNLKLAVSNTDGTWTADCTR